MRKISILVLAFVLLVNNGFGSPLIFKFSKEIDTKGKFIELATLDVAKYKQIRTSVSLPKTDLSENEGAAFFAVDGTDEIFLTNEVEDNVLDSPPAKIKIYVKGRGKFTVYVWGQ